MSFTLSKTAKTLLKEYQILNNHLIIIESLKPGEHRTGKWLHDDLIKFSYLNDKFSIEYYPIASKFELFKTLEEIKTRKEILPIIHLEIHGDQEGIQTGVSNEFISWKDLISKLSEINHASRNNLIFTAGICNGFFINVDLIQSFSDSKFCPFACNIGSIDIVHPNEITKGFHDFYTYLFEGKEFSPAIKSLNSQIRGFSILTSDSLAIKTLETTVFDHLKESTQDFCARTYSHLKSNGNLPLPNQSANQNIKHIKKFRRNFFYTTLKENWEGFLGINEFTELRERYPGFDTIWRVYS